MSEATPRLEQSLRHGNSFSHRHPTATMSATIAFAFTFVSGIVAALILISFSKYLFKLLPSRYRPAQDPKHDRYQILVLGDIGRSPRMQYHALSIVKSGAYVDLVGYKGIFSQLTCVSNQELLTWIDE